MMECAFSERPRINDTKPGNYSPWFLILEQISNLIRCNHGWSLRVKAWGKISSELREHKESLIHMVLSSSFLQAQLEEMTAMKTSCP